MALSVLLLQILRRQSAGEMEALICSSGFRIGYLRDRHDAGALRQKRAVIKWKYVGLFARARGGAKVSFDSHKMIRCFTNV